MGHQNEKEKPTWNPIEVIKVGSFVILNPSKDWKKEHGIEEVFWVVKA